MTYVARSIGSKEYTSTQQLGNKMLDHAIHDHVLRKIRYFKDRVLTSRSKEIERETALRWNVYIYEKKRFIIAKKLNSAQMEDLPVHSIVVDYLVSPSP